MRAYGFARHWSRAGEQVSVVTTRKATGDLALTCDGIEVLVPPEERRWPRTVAAAGRRWIGSGGWLSRLCARSGIYQGVRMPDRSDGWVEPAIALARARGPWDIVFSTSPPYTAHLVARRLRTAGPRWVMDLRDLWSGNCAHPGLWPFSWLERWLEWRCLREADLVISASPAWPAELRRLGARCVQVVPNAHDPDLAGYREANPGVTDLDLVYTGRLYPESHDAVALLRALRRLERAGRRPLRLTVAGAGAARWQALADREGARDLVDVRGVVSRETAWRLQHRARILVVLDWLAPEAGVVTSKVFEYLFAQAPILALGGDPGSEVGRLLAELGRGRHAGGRLDVIGQTLSELLDHPERFAGSAVALARHTRRRRSGELLDHFRSLVKSRHTDGRPVREWPGTPQ